MRVVKIIGMVMITLLVGSVLLGQVAFAARPIDSTTGTKELTVSGKVISSSGSGIANATVRVHKPIIAAAGGRDVRDLTVITDQQGKYFIKAIPPGSYTMTVSKDGYTSSTRSLKITNANQIQNFTLEPPKYKVSGIVSSGGKRIDQAKVEISGKTAFTDSQGNFQIGGFLPGSYPIRVSKAGYIPLTRDIVIANENKNQNIELMVAPTYGNPSIIPGVPISETL